MEAALLDNRDVASFLVTKLSNWRGKYKRIMTVGSHTLTTYNPGSMEVTNQWPYSEVVSLKPQDRSELVLTVQNKKKKRDTMRFACDYRPELLCEFLAAKAGSEASSRPSINVLIQSTAEN